MEERLFLIGVIMGLYAALSRYFKNRGSFRSPLGCGLWHGIFCAVAAFSACLVLLVSWGGRFEAASADLFSKATLFPSAIAAVFGALIGFWRGWESKGSNQKHDVFLSEDSEWAETVFSAVILAAFLMYFVVQAFKIPSASMESTLMIGDHLFVNKFIYGVRDPFSGRRFWELEPVKRHDIIVFRFPVDDPKALHCGSSQYGKDFIKRVIGLPGDAVQVKNGTVMVNGKPVGEEPYAQYLDGPMRQPPSVLAGVLPHDQYQTLWQNHELDHELQDVERDYFGPVTVPAGEYFAMGDNRDRSCDSRYWGPVPMKYIEGKAWFIYWPPSRIRILK